jgi:hypothetical protein
MNDSSRAVGLKLGQKVPDFEMTTYDPVAGDFGRVWLARATRCARRSGARKAT